MLYKSPHIDPDTVSKDDEWWDKVVKNNFCTQLYLQKKKKKGGHSEPVYYYVMGPKSKIEIGRIAVLEHVAKVYYFIPF